MPGQPGAFVACGSSGHGFKFGSIIGRVVMDRLDAGDGGEFGPGSSGWWVPQFSWSAALAARERNVVATPI